MTTPDLPLIIPAYNEEALIGFPGFAVKGGRIWG